MGKFLDWLNGVTPEGPEANILEVRSDSPSTPAPPQLPILNTSVDSILGLGPVGRSVGLIKTIGGSIGWAAHNEKTSRKLDRQPALITKPGTDGSPYVFITETLDGLATWGNAYWWLHGSGTSLSLEVCAPERMHVYRDHQTAQVKYDYTDEFGRAWKNIPVKHLKMNRRAGHLYGYGPIQLYKSELIQGLKIRAYADNAFSSVPRIALRSTSDYIATDKEKADVVNGYIEAVSTGVGVVVTDSYAIDHIDRSPNELQYTSVWQEFVKNVARMFGIPAMHLIAEPGGTSMTYTNLEQDQILFLQDTIVAYLNEIEDAMTSLLPRGTVCKFNEDDLLRMDHKTKSAVRKTAIETGITTADELRAEDGRDPLPRKEADTANNE